MTDYTRKNRVITPNPETGEDHKAFASINKAKRESRRLQNAGHTVRKT